MYYKAFKMVCLGIEIANLGKSYAIHGAESKEQLMYLSKNCIQDLEIHNE